MVDTQKFKNWVWRSYCNDRTAFIASAEEFFKQESTIDGWAAAPLMGILNFVVAQCLEHDEAYLEVGVYAGRSLVGALKGTTADAYAIDNFWDSDALSQTFHANIAKFNINNKIALFEGNSLECDLPLPKIGLMLYDANHDRGHTHMNLNHFEQYLNDEAIIIVDDVEIEAGESHACYPGYEMKSNMPVLDDIIQWLREHPKSDLFMLTPWTFKQAIILYRR